MEDYEVDSSWKNRTLIAGTVIGALTGLAAAYLLTRRAEKDEATSAITTSQGLKLGLLVLGLLRQIGQLGDD